MTDGAVGPPSGPMRAAMLPRRPLALTELGFGAAQGGNLYRVTTDAEFADAVETAWTGGVRYVDTAPHYGLGLSERRLGALLRGRPRAEYVLSTKVGRLLEPSPATAHERDLDHGGMFDVPADVRRVWDFTADGVRRSLEASLERLGLDRVDVVYLHDPDESGQLDVAIAEALPALAALRDEGVVRAIGAGMNAAAPLARVVREGDVDVVMCAGRYTLLDASAADDLLPLCLERGVGVVVAGVYNSGLLAHDRPPSDATYDYTQAPRELLERAHRIADVCEAHGVTLPEAALAFVRGHPAVVSTVVGLRTAAQVTQALRRSAADVPAALWSELQARGLLRADAPVPA